MDKVKYFYAFVTEFWKFMKKYIPVPADSDQQKWDEFTQDSTILFKQFNKAEHPKESKFFKECVIAFMNYCTEYTKEETREEYVGDDEEF